MNKIIITAILTIITFNAMVQKKIVPTAGRTQLGEFAPEFAHLNDDILFGEVWSRNDLLSLRDRSLVTLTCLISQGLTDSSLTYHLQTAKANGITRTEISEIITHIAFYAGWPKAWAAFRLAKDFWNDSVTATTEKEKFQKEMIFPIGDPNTAYAKYFKGNSYLARISSDQIPFANVTFEPGCRNNWHIHHATKDGGQMLVGVAGKGWYQEAGKPAQVILPGTVIHIPANVNLGATKSTTNFPNNRNSGGHALCLPKHTQLYMRRVARSKAHAAFSFSRKQCGCRDKGKC